MKRGQRPRERREEMLLRVGLIAPDTEFNRRAKAYADEARRDADCKRTAARQKLRKTNQENKT